MSTLTTCLWSVEVNALEMAEYYCSVFPNSEITNKWYYDAPNEYLPGSKAWDVMLVEFTLLWDCPFMTLNGWPYFQHSWAISFMVPCQSQSDLDHYYDTLSALPEAEQCGWVTDKYGISWQLIPDNYTDYVKNGTPEGRSRLMKAILDMKRLSWDAVEKAYNG